ncbi:MAG: oxidoreductase [Pelagibacterales bacterium]|nr:oxidoreductase [Pelagibacterales bacterium]|tara:strand:- start:4594 stop:5565 length:972 start_codon:yes stop_codon:yes gene_type:complete
MKNFALIGVSGYIAPRHLSAIKDTNNNLIAALDPSDSVGIIDRFFPKTDFFTEFARFDRHIEKIRYEKKINLDYVSICSPNYLHDSHIRMALRRGAHAICEKPLVLNPWNLDPLKLMEKETGCKVYNVLQLRFHKSIIELKKKIDLSSKDKVFDIDLTYITSRGNWYYTSWKGDEVKAGGVTTNIGIHFFDMLAWIFGAVKANVVHLHTHDRASGYLEFDRARVRWFLSINSDVLPKEIKESGQTTFRSIKIENEELEFSSGFTNLHNEVYKSILGGQGNGIEDARTSVEIAHDIRSANPIGLKGDYHPMAKHKLTKHPFSKK